MPELPEVETIRRGLAPLVVGRRFGDAWAFPHPKFLPALEAAGAPVTRLDRRGKYLLFGLAAPPGEGHGGTEPHGDRDGLAAPPGEGSAGAELVVHLGMTGSLRVRPAGEVRGVEPGEPAGATGPPPAVPDAGGGPVPDPHVRAWWDLGAGERLVLRDVRRFGRLAFVEDGQYRGTLAVQGPDALDPDLGPEELWRALRSSRRAVKTQLLSQRPVAGVGNIYADEALWRARIDPRARRVGRARAAELLEALREVLTASLGNGGTTLRDYRDAAGGTGRNQRRLACYGRGGEPCLRCGTALRRVVLDGRSTTFCPSCQR